ncbi:MAG: 3-deoxy-8-phosphooctulonate synthase [Planctomycetaceae bacterium]|nr:3-deoxy-8-phosphooctulonate synthase [Planctomycetaceae bacterium]
MKSEPAKIGPYRCGIGNPLLVIAGPCVIEDAEKTLAIAETLADIDQRLDVNIVFKASFDKANRTSLNAFRGVGLTHGLEILQMVTEKTGLPVTTDIHEPAQAVAVGAVCAMLQIPAFLCRQTDLLLAAAATGCAVNAKKGQFLAPEDMQHVIQKLQGGGCENVLVCERGTFFGYGRLASDTKSLVGLGQLGVPVLFDATHSVQQPGSLPGATGGNRELVEPLARAAVAVGIDGLFFETHPVPDQSPSDGQNMIPLDKFEEMLSRLLRLRETTLEILP